MYEDGDGCSFLAGILVGQQIRCTKGVAKQVIAMPQNKCYLKIQS